MDRKLVEDLASLRFIEERRPLLFLSQPGCGKTLLAVALATRAVEAGYLVTTNNGGNYLFQGVSPGDYSIEIRGDRYQAVGSGDGLLDINVPPDSAAVHFDLSLVCKSWCAQKSGTKQPLFDVSFPDSKHGWAVGGAGTIVATADGVHWESQSSGTGEALVAVSFPDTSHGWAVGFDDTIVATSDGGAHWTAEPVGAGNVLLTDVVFVDSLHGWIVDYSGAIFGTVDGGATWMMQQASRSTTSLYGVSSPDVNDAWAVGDNSRVVATDDGGTQWLSQATGTSYDLRKVASPTPATAGGRVPGVDHCNIRRRGPMGR